MADVTGQFGQEDIVLNNAATEATLKQILAAMKIVAASSAKDFKSQQELEKALGDLAGKTKIAAANGKKFNDSTLRSYKAKEKETDAVEDNIKAYQGAVQGLTKLRDTTTKAAGAITGLINRVSSAVDSIRGMDGSISSAVGALGQIPMGVGEVIKGIFGPVAGAVDQTHQAFMEAASVGANFGGNMRDLLRSSGQAGLSLSEFSGIVKNNSEALMFLGGDTATGAKRLADLGKQIRNTPLAADLARLGYSTADINEGFADYSKMLARSGRLEGMSNAQLIQQTGDYLKNLDAVSKLTGKTKESLQAEQDARMADAQFMQMKRKLDADGQKQLELLMQTIPKQHQQGLKEILATGHATSEEGVRAMAFLKSTGQSAQGLFQSMQSTGTLTKDQVIGFNKTYQAEAKAIADSPLITTLAKYDEGAAAFVTGIYETAGRQKDIGTIYEELEKRLNELKSKPPPDLIDPNTVQQFKQDVNDKATQMTEALASVDLSKLKEVFNKAADLAIEYLPKAVNLAAENFELVAGTVLGLNAAALLASAALKALSLSAGTGMFGGGDGPGGRRGRMGRAGGKLNMMKNVGRGVMRFGAPLAIAGAMYEGYQGYSEANEKLAAGEITANEATVEKTKAVSGAVGGGGGALAGAAAGAAIGSVVPIVGTAIGGLIGGAIGYWAGSKGGEMIGEQIGNVIAGEDTIKDLEAQIAEEQARIDRSKAGVNEYWGSEASGIEDSQAKIEQMRKDMELVRKRTEELKAQEKAAAEAAATAAGTPAPATAQAATEADAAVSSVSSTTATDAQKKLEADKEAADKKVTEEAKKKEEELKKKQEQASSAVNSAVQTKKTPEEVMLALNNNIEELVNLTRMSNALTQKHIGVTSGLTSDAFTV
jgi:hypothetical protein